MNYLRFQSILRLLSFQSFLSIQSFQNFLRYWSLVKSSTCETNFDLSLFTSPKATFQSFLNISSHRIRPNSATILIVNKI